MAGTLQNDATATPTHVPPALIMLGLSVDGTLSLDDIDKKTVRIYKDHLARDMENFDGETERTDDNWHFKKFNVEATETKLNCHGSVRHAYDGYDGSWPGFYSLTDMQTWLGQTHVAFKRCDYPFNNDSIAAIISMNRGDIVAYYRSSSLQEPQHTAMCVIGAMIWGANNSPLDMTKSGTDAQTWKFAKRSVFDVMRDYNRVDSTINCIIIYKPN